MKAIPDVAPGAASSLARSGAFGRLSGALYRTRLARDPGTTGKEGRTGSQADVEIEVVRDPAAIECLAPDWARLLDVSKSPEKIYQSPAFYRYIVESADPVREPYVLLVVRQRDNQAIIGIVPARLGRYTICAGIGPNRWRSHVPVVQLLGSVPLLEQRPGLFGAVLARLLEELPMTRAVSLQALPVELRGQLRTLEGMASCAPDGWRDCHTIPLPADFATYLQKLTAKKRYNLARQIRLLAKAAGPLVVHPVECPEQVPALAAALSALLSPAAAAAFARPGRFERLAANGLLLSYVVSCGEEPVGVIVATRSADKWLIHNILSAKEYAHLSPGTSTLHLALEDVMRERGFGWADFGYGSPNQDFRSTHVLQRRAHVLVYRRMGWMPVALACYCLYRRLSGLVGAAVKVLLRHLNTRPALRRNRAGGQKPA